MYGPYVYCLEETDNGAELCNLYVSPDAKIQVEVPKTELPGALPTLTFTGKRLDSGTGSELYGQPRFSFTEQKLTAVPYGLWCNRAPAAQLVNKFL